MIEVNVVDAVLIQKKINEEINFLTKTIIEAPTDLKEEFQKLITARQNELVSIDDGIQKAILLVPETTSRFKVALPILQEISK